MAKEILAFKRKSGYGIRNYTLVISTVQCANTVAEKIAWATGATPITHDWGCVEFQDHHEATYLALSSIGKNPNVHSVLIVGLGCEQTNAQKLAEELTAEGKEVAHLCIQEEGGSPQTVEKGIDIVRYMQKKALLQERERVSLEGLVVGVQCGGSDWTTALFGNTVIGVMTDLVVQHGGSVIMSEVGGFPGSEHIVAERAVSYEVGCQILDMCNEIRREFKRKHGQTMEEINPTPGNKAGGITTLVEKSMGNIKKMGSSPVQGLIRLGEQVPHPGLWILDLRSEGPDSHNTTGFAMCTAHATVFSTGRGSPLGNAVMPVVKITGNPESFKKLESILDFNAGAVIEGSTIAETGEDLFHLLLEIASGKETKTEINGNFEFTIPREGARN